MYNHFQKRGSLPKLHVILERLIKKKIYEKKCVTCIKQRIPYMNWYFHDLHYED